MKNKINMNTQRQQNQKRIEGVEYVKGSVLVKELEQIIQKYGSKEARAINYDGVPEWLARGEIAMMLELGQWDEFEKKYGY